MFVDGVVVMLMGSLGNVLVVVVDQVIGEVYVGIGEGCSIFDGFVCVVFFVIVNIGIILVFNKLIMEV